MDSRLSPLLLVVLPLFSSCTSENGSQATLPFEPVEIIDLGALVTEDLSERMLGKALVNEVWAPFGLDRPNSFDVIRWNFEMPGGSVSGSNAYYTLQNHGGPHVDAPNPTQNHHPHLRSLRVPRHVAS